MPEQDYTIPGTTIKQNVDNNQEIADELNKIVHDSPFDFKSMDEYDKTGDKVRGGFPRYEW